MVTCNPPAGIAKPILVEKRWGYEKIFINGEHESTDHLNAYCMKEIYIRHGNTTSMHFHVNKHETLYVVQGTLTLYYLDGKGSNRHESVIPAGLAIQVPPGFMHQLCAWDNDVVIIEASTPDSPSDSFRVSM